MIHHYDDEYLVDIYTDENGELIFDNSIVGGDTQNMKEFIVRVLTDKGIYILENDKSVTLEDLFNSTAYSKQVNTDDWDTMF